MTQFLSMIAGLLVGGIIAAGIGILATRRASGRSILPQPKPIDPSRYVERDLPHMGPFDLIRDLDGVEWNDAPLPPPVHRCWVQTDAWLGMRNVQRCACGAIRMLPDEVWVDRNQTRKWMDKKQTS
jgi:hypothetical protein